LKVENDSAIPDGDYELHPEGVPHIRNVMKSGNSWSVV
jgi:hypothetical protein